MLKINILSKIQNFELVPNFDFFQSQKYFSHRYLWQGDRPCKEAFSLNKSINTNSTTSVQHRKNQIGNQFGTDFLATLNLHDNVPHITISWPSLAFMGFRIWGAKSTPVHSASHSTSLSN